MATAALPFTVANLEQQLVTGLVSGTGYALVAVGFGLIITVTGRFHIAYGVTYALSAFIAGQTGLSWGLSFPAAPSLRFSGQYTRLSIRAATTTAARTPHTSAAGNDSPQDSPVCPAMNADSA